MVGRALLNYDNLTYEGQLNDYCSCFGAASDEIRRYFNALEKLHWRALKSGNGILADYPVDALAGQLEKAAAKVAGDPESLERVRFLQKGIIIAREEIKLYKAWYTTEWKPLIAARKVYKEFVCRFAMEDPVALHPGSLGFKGPFLRGTPRRTPEQRAYYAAKQAAERAKKSAAAREAEAKATKGYTDGEGNFVEQGEEGKGEGRTAK